MGGLRQAAEDYLAMRRSLGFALVREGQMLMSFITHLEQAGAASITTELAVSWAVRTRPGVNPACRNRRLTVVRIFARHLHAIDPSAEVPPAGLMASHYPRVTPHLYTPEEITALMTAAAALKHPLRALTYQTLIGLLGITGMRVGEACGLDCTDVDLEAGLLTIRAGKLGKAREVPLHPTATQALRAYGQQRDQLCRVVSTPGFFVNTRGNRLAARHVPEVFAELREAAGIRPAPGGRNPRAHDLRHSFCVATMVGWYRAGVDVHAHLPLLSTYVGHVDPVSTYWYLQEGSGIASDGRRLPGSAAMQAA
ncbi:MAG TPA: tyrosine-type recombinase/integrase [Streptosporangiaceae bacterium]|nr:tyrosine-type recombinase/integrase [Streptosporangiaceae bacterium]